jgi:hypothetical protein
MTIRLCDIAIGQKIIEFAVTTLQIDASLGKVTDPTLIDTPVLEREVRRQIDLHSWVSSAISHFSSIC